MLIIATDYGFVKHFFIIFENYCKFPMLEKMDAICYHKIKGGGDCAQKMDSNTFDNRMDSFNLDRLRHNRNGANDRQFAEYCCIFSGDLSTSIADHLSTDIPTHTAAFGAAGRSHCGLH